MSRILKLFFLIGLMSFRLWAGAELQGQWLPKILKFESPEETSEVSPTESEDSDESLASVGRYEAKPLPGPDEAYTTSDWHNDFRVWYRLTMKRDIDRRYKKDSEEKKALHAFIDAAWGNQTAYWEAAKVLDKLNCLDPFYIYLRVHANDFYHKKEYAQKIIASLKAARKMRADPMGSLLLLDMLRFGYWEFRTQETDRMHLSLLKDAANPSWGDELSRIRYWFINLEYIGTPRGMHAQAAKWSKGLKAPPNVHPYIFHYIVGDYHIDEAWKERGNGFANTVTSEGWEKFKEHLVLARMHMTLSYESMPKLPYASSKMITISMADGGGHELRMWFDRSVAANFEHKSSYTRYMWAIMPRWHGSHEMIHDFAKECWQTKRFETDIPYFYVTHHNEIRKDHEKWEDYLTEEVLAETQSFMNDVLAFKGSRWNDWWVHSYMTAMSAKAGDNKRLLYHNRRLDGHRPDKKHLKRFDLSTELFDQILRLASNKKTSITPGILSFIKEDPAEISEEVIAWLTKDSEDQETHDFKLDSIFRFEFSGDVKRNSQVIQIMKHHRLKERVYGLFTMFLRDFGHYPPIVDKLKEELVPWCNPLELKAIEIYARHMAMKDSDINTFKKKIQELFNGSGESPDALTRSIIRLCAQRSASPYKQKRGMFGRDIKASKEMGWLNDFAHAAVGGGHLRNSRRSLVQSAYWWNRVRNRPLKVKDFEKKFEAGLTDDEVMALYQKEGHPFTSLIMARILRDEGRDQLAMVLRDRGRRWVEYYSRIYGHQKVSSYRAMQTLMVSEEHLEDAKMYGEKHYANRDICDSGCVFYAYLMLKDGQLEKGIQALERSKKMKRDSGVFYLDELEFRKVNDLREYVKARFLEDMGMTEELKARVIKL